MHGVSESESAIVIQLSRTKASFIVAVTCMVVVTCMLLTAAASAQESRLRTLTYDIQQKKWVEKPPPPVGTAEGDLHEIRTQIKQAKYAKALSALKKFTGKYGDLLVPESLILKAEALIAQRKHEKAHEVLQTFLAQFSGMRLTAEALRLEFEIAENFLKGDKRKGFMLFRVSAVELAYEILDEIATDHPDSRLAELAHKVKGDHLFLVGEHALAEIEYAQILRDYPQSRYYEFAMSRTAQAALASFGGVEYDEAALIEAEERYNDYRVRYPASARRDGVDLILQSVVELQAEKDYGIAAYYERSDHPGAAIFYYRSVRDNWSDTVAAAKATARLELLGVIEPAASAQPPTP